MSKSKKIKKEKHPTAKKRSKKKLQKNYAHFLKKGTREISTVLNFLFRELSEKIMSTKESKYGLNAGRKIVIAFSINLVCVFSFLAVLSISGRIEFGKLSDFIILIILSIIGPFSFYEYARLKKIDKLEKHLPDFLRDLAENGRSGMPLHTAIRTASHGKYGLLTPEIKRMAIQISWGASSSTALKGFAKRVNTPLVNRCVNLIIEASNAGGNVGDVLSASARDTSEIQLLQEQRKIEMSTYTAVVYISFFVFLSVVLVLSTSLIPSMEKAQESGGQGAVTEEVGAGNIKMGGAFDVEKIKFFYLSAAVVQGLGDGLAAGVINDGRIVTGLRHSFIMVFIGFILLRLLI